MKAINIILRVVLVLMLIAPILGTFGIFPKPTPDLYNTAEAFAFIEALYVAQYIMWTMALVFTASIVLIVRNQMAAAALLMLPITVNIVGFHAFLDGGIFTMGALMGNVLGLINVYFLWKNRAVYKGLLTKSVN